MEKSNAILIVEDEPIIAEDILGHLKDAGYSNVHVTHTLIDAQHTLANRDIDFVLIDVFLENSNEGISLAKQINADYQVPFVFITSNADAKTIDEIRQTHPVGYILKPFHGKEISASIQIGYSLFYTFIAPEKEIQVEKFNRIFSTELTAKEKDVLAKTLAGKSNKLIADELFVSLNTVKTHLKNIFIKADIRSRAELIVLCNKG